MNEIILETDDNMTILEVFLLIMNLCLGALCVFIERHVKRTADLLTERELAYQGEKGKNLATKEDIEEITKKVEEVKTEVSLSKQQKYDTIIEQKQLLLDLLNDATIITQAQNKLLLYLYDTSSRTRYDSLVEKVTDTLGHFYHVSNIAIVSVPIANIEDVIRELSVTVTLFGSYVNVTATNAASLVEQINSRMDYAMNPTTNEQSREEWLTRNMLTKQDLVAMRNKANPYKDEMQSAIEKYCAWLKQLYGNDFFAYKS